MSAEQSSLIASFRQVSRILLLGSDCPARDRRRRRSASSKKIASAEGEAVVQTQPDSMFPRVGIDARQTHQLSLRLVMVQF